MTTNPVLAAAKIIVSSLSLATTRAEIIARLEAATGIDWGLLVHHADGHSLTPLLYDVWQQAGALKFVPQDIRQQMARAYADNSQRNLNIKAEFLEVHQILNLADPPHLVLKGWPLVEQLYTNPAHRVLYDHDFLVSAERAGAGFEALRKAGFVPLPGKDEWVEKHLSPLWRNNGYQWDGYLFDPDYPRPVELHLRLWEQGWRGLRIKTLAKPWANTRICTVAGVPLQLLSLENTLVHLSMHFAGHLIEREARLNQLLDLARFVNKEHGAINWAMVVQQGERANVTRFVYASLWLAHSIFAAPLPPDAIWQEMTAATPPAFCHWLSEQGVTDVLTADYRQREKGKDYQLTFLAAQSITERFGILRFAAIPPMAQLATKYQLRYRWMGPLLYPRYLFERVGEYGRGVLGN